MCLRNIETGVIAAEHVNADRARDVGLGILQDMSSKLVTEYSFKRKRQVVPLHSKKASKEDTEVPCIQIDPQLMFQRLVIAGDGHFTDNSELFKFELSSLPSSMFDNNGYPREASKSLLADAIWDDQCLADCQLEQDAQYVLDGGSLLQRIPWEMGTTFSKLCSTYIEHVKRTYQESIVVFDGYPDRPTLKDTTHLRRSKGYKTTDVVFTETTPCKMKKELFLANDRNKQKFISLLASKMQSEGIKVLQADDDADFLIAKTALTCAESRTTVVIGEDTDILVLLCHHFCKDHVKDIIFRSAKQTSGKACRIWSINRTANMLGQTTCKHLPFVHAISGCDTTSRLYGIGKGMVLKKCISSGYFREQAEVFFDSSSDRDAVIKAGEEAISNLYGGIPCEGLQILRWRKFTSKAVQNRCTPVMVQTLPPTPDAASHHSLRSYLQCQIWQGDQTVRDATEWGWKIEKNVLVPIKMTLQPAPDNILNIIKCNCKANCDSKRCTCRKSGLECSMACGECRGMCSNGISQIEEEDEVENDSANLD